jgi:exopolyphosphatase / guanosine-5'-triphosphate,3'-diphosphate pyrophosphatase
MQDFVSLGARRDLEPLGVVDIGSNSVRLVVYDGAVRSPTPIFNEKVLCGLGREVASTGRLDDGSVIRALEALRRFRAIAHILGVKRIHAIATAACRDASNGPQFVVRGEIALGTTIQLLTGQQEARLAARGILMGFRSPDGVAGDIGGGSLELVDIADEAMHESVTLPLGGLRLLDASGHRLERASELADAALAGVPWLGQGRGRSFYAVGGTWRAIARLHMEATDYPLHVMHAYATPAREMAAFCEDLRRTRKLSALKGIAKVAKPRREVLPIGALVLERVLKRLQPREVVFSVYGIREGLLYGLLSETERRKDPLLSFCAEYARLRSRSAEHAVELCRWTDPLFRPPGPAESEDERRLRWAACLLSDTSWRAHPDYRAEQSLILTAQSALAAIDHPGRVFLAFAGYFRHLGAGREDDSEATDKLSQRLKTILSKRLHRRARIIGAAVRTAHMLSIGRPGVIDRTPLVYERDKLILRLPKALAALDGERLRRRLSYLGELLERAVDIRIV